MRRTTLLVAGLLTLLAATLDARRRGVDMAAADAVQPPHSSRGLVMLTTPGAARIETADGRHRTLRLRRDEELIAVAELGPDWIAAGIRHQAEGADLLVMRSGGSGSSRLTPPRSAGRALRLAPVLLVDSGRLAGMAWLEGDEYGGLGVRAAAWSGESWGEAVTVSRPGPRSQTGLSGTVLADGSWLLVWSAHDGNDDEIVWSRLLGDNWSEPRRAFPGNGWADITPALLAVDGGALLAWSRSDGEDYRLATAHFTESGWSTPRDIGPAGSLFPSLTTREGRPVVLARYAMASGWAALELDDAGAVAREAVAADAPRGRPIVESTLASARMRWPAAGSTRTALWTARK